MMNDVLEYRLSNGNWFPVDSNRRDEFLSRCEKYNGMDSTSAIVPSFKARRALTRSEVIGALKSGHILRNHNADWYSQCRYRPAPPPTPAPVETIECTCGHSVHPSLVMNASLGTSCPDCYDRLSA